MIDQDTYYIILLSGLSIISAILWLVVWGDIKDKTKR